MWYAVDFLEWLDLFVGTFILILLILFFGLNPILHLNIFIADFFNLITTFLNFITTVLNPIIVTITSKIPNIFYLRFDLFAINFLDPSYLRFPSDSIFPPLNGSKQFQPTF